MDKMDKVVEKLADFIGKYPMTIFCLLIYGALWSLNMEKAPLLLIGVYGSAILALLGFEQAGMWLFDKFVR
jgi:hypothetical protein